MEKKFTSANFDAEVLQEKLPVLVDFFATWCGPCKMLAPVIGTLAEEYEGKAVVGKLDVDESSDIAARYGVMSIPTLLLFKDGQVVYKAVGLQTRAELEQALEAEL